MNNRYFTYLVFIFYFSICCKTFCADSYEILIPKSDFRLISFKEICNMGEQEKIIEWLNHVVTFENTELINSLNKEGFTPLMYAINYNLDIIVKKMVNIVVNIDQQTNQYKFTALHLAILSGKPDFVSYLLQANSNIDIKNKNKQDAFSIACFLQNDEILDLIISCSNLSQKRISEELAIAINKKRAKVLTKLSQINNIIDDNCFISAINNNSIEIIKKVLNSEKSIKPSNIYNALLAQNFEILILFANKLTNVYSSKWNDYNAVIEECLLMEEKDLEGRFNFLKSNKNSLYYNDNYVNHKEKEDYYKDIYSYCMNIDKAEDPDRILSILIKSIKITDETSVYIIRLLNAVDIKQFIRKSNQNIIRIISDNPLLLAILLSEEMPINNNLKNIKSANSAK